MDILSIDVDFIVDDNGNLQEGNLEYLKDICTQARQFGPKVFVGTKHDEILQHIGLNEVVILNIDHHHDVYYPNQDGFDTILRMQPTESTWVKYLELTGQLKGYVWVKNEDSDVSGMNALWLRSMVMHKENFKVLPKIDMVFVCKSPQYLPQNLWSTFEDVYGTLCTN